MPNCFETCHVDLIINRSYKNKNDVKKLEYLLLVSRSIKHISISD